MNKQSLSALIATSLIWTAVSCQSGPNNGNTPRPATQGTSSGGGDFKNQGARRLLQRTSKELATEIRNASPQVFSDFPGGHTQQSFAALIEGLRFDEANVARREGELLGFDYRRTDGGGAHYLIATKTIFDELGSINFSTISPDQLSERILDLKVRLLHEAGHVLGIGRTKRTDALARYFAVALYGRLFNDNFVCVATYDQASPEWNVKNDIAENYAQYLEGNPTNIQKLSQRKFIWFINRSSGRGSFISAAMGLNEEFTDRREDAFFDYRSFMEDFSDVKDDSPFISNRYLVTVSDRKRLGQTFPFFSPYIYSEDKINVHDWKTINTQPANLVQFETSNGNRLAPNASTQAMAKITVNFGRKNADDTYSGVYSFAFRAKSLFSDDIETSEGSFTISCKRNGDIANPEDALTNSLIRSNDEIATNQHFLDDINLILRMILEY